MSGVDQRLAKRRHAHVEEPVLRVQGVRVRCRCPHTWLVHPSKVGRLCHACDGRYEVVR